MDLSSIGKTNPNVTAPYESPVPRQAAEEQRTLIQAVKAVSAAALFGQDNELTFVLDRNTRRAVVRIVNRETREVVDQIPNEYVLRMAEELKEAEHMSNNAFEHYLEAEVLSADPVKLVSLLYRGALEATGAARRHLAQGAICDRSRQINRAWEIVQELSTSLDHANGGKLSAELAELYHYIQVRLLEANSQQTDAPLAEVEALLATLGEAWREIQPKTGVLPPPADYVPVACSA